MVPTWVHWPKNVFDKSKTERRNQGSYYENGHISGITYGTRLEVVPMDRYLFGVSYEIVLNKFGTTEWSETKEVST